MGPEEIQKLEGFVSKSEFQSTTCVVREAVSFRMFAGEQMGDIQRKMSTFKVDCVGKGSEFILTVVSKQLTDEVDIMEVNLIARFKLSKKS